MQFGEHNAGDARLSLRHLRAHGIAVEEE